MSRKRNHIANHKLKLSTIVERLPLYRFLSDSRATVLKLQPAWQTWLNRQLPDLTDNAAHISGFDAKTLTISVNNASTAALIKHQQDSLLSALNIYDGVHINTVKLRIDLGATSAAAELQKTITGEPDATQAFNAPDQTAINSVKHLQAGIKNPDLAETLGDLAETLEQLSKKKD